MDLKKWLYEPLAARGLADDVLATIIIFALVLGVRFAILRFFQKNQKLTLEHRQKWFGYTRNTSVLILLVAMTFVWVEEIRSYALSLTGIAVATVLATKEVVACLTGTLLRSSSEAFSVGDRIEFDSIRGDVVDASLLTTTLMEVGPGKNGHRHTGRSIVIPNSLFFGTPITNETFNERYLVHNFFVPLHRDEDWERAEAVLLESVEANAGAYLEDAKRHFRAQNERRGLEPTVVDPQITVQLTSPEEIALSVRVPVPAFKRGRIEQKILRDFLRNYKNGSAKKAN